MWSLNLQGHMYKLFLSPSVSAAFPQIYAPIKHPIPTLLSIPPALSVVEAPTYATYT